MKRAIGTSAHGTAESVNDTRSAKWQRIGYTVAGLGVDAAAALVVQQTAFAGSDASAAAMCGGVNGAMIATAVLAGRRLAESERGTQLYSKWNSDGLNGVAQAVLFGTAIEVQIGEEKENGSDDVMKETKAPEAMMAGKVGKRTACVAAKAAELTFKGGCHAAHLLAKTGRGAAHVAAKTSVKAAKATSKASVIAAKVASKTGRQAANAATKASVTAAKATSKAGCQAAKMTSKASVSAAKVTSKAAVKASHAAKISAIKTSKATALAAKFTARATIKAALAAKHYVPIATRAAIEIGREITYPTNSETRLVVVTKRSAEAASVLADVAATSAAQGTSYMRLMQKQARDKRTSEEIPSSTATSLQESLETIETEVRSTACNSDHEVVAPGMPATSMQEESAEPIPSSTHSAPEEILAQDENVELAPVSMEHLPDFDANDVNDRESQSETSAPEDILVQEEVAPLATAAQERKRPSVSCTTSHRRLSGVMHRIARPLTNEGRSEQRNSDQRVEETFVIEGDLVAQSFIDPQGQVQESSPMVTDHEPNEQDESIADEKKQTASVEEPVCSNESEASLMDEEERVADQEPNQEQQIIANGENSNETSESPLSPLPSFSVSEQEEVEADDEEMLVHEESVADAEKLIIEASVTEEQLMNEKSVADEEQPMNEESVAEEQSMHEESVVDEEQLMNKERAADDEKLMNVDGCNANAAKPESDDFTKIDVATENEQKFTDERVGNEKFTEEKVMNRQQADAEQTFLQVEESSPVQESPQVEEVIAGMEEISANILTVSIEAPSAHVLTASTEEKLIDDGDLVSEHELEDHCAARSECEHTLTGEQDVDEKEDGDVTSSAEWEDESHHGGDNEADRSCTQLVPEGGEFECSNEEL